MRVTDTRDVTRHYWTAKELIEGINSNQIKAYTSANKYAPVAMYQILIAAEKYPDMMFSNNLPAEQNYLKYDDKQMNERVDVYVLPEYENIFWKNCTSMFGD